MKTNINHGEHYTPIQMKFPVDLERIIEIFDPIYTFNEIMSKLGLKKYFVAERNNGQKIPRRYVQNCKLQKR